MKFLSHLLLAIGVTIGSVAGVYGDEKNPFQPADKCGDYGTSVKFAESPATAAKEALKAEKLVLILHVSGHFEDPTLT